MFYGISTFAGLFNAKGWNFWGIVANLLDSDIVLSKFELQSQYYVHLLTNTLRRGMNLLIHQASDLIVPLLFFYKDIIGIRLPANVDMLLNKHSMLTSGFLFKQLYEFMTATDMNILQTILNSSNFFPSYH